MIFGDPDTFAVEIGITERFPGFRGIYVQFRFWIDRLAIGDWEDRIPLVASIEYFKTICSFAENRREWLFERVPASEVFQKVYYAFFEYDYSINPLIVPNLRDRFHLDGIGMGSVQDKFGIVLVASSRETERILAKDLKEGTIVADVVVPFGFVESVGIGYVRWGQTQLE